MELVENWVINSDVTGRGTTLKKVFKFCVFFFRKTATKFCASFHNFFHIGFWGYFWDHGLQNSKLRTHGNPTGIDFAKRGSNHASNRTTANPPVTSTAVSHSRVERGVRRLADGRRSLVLQRTQRGSVVIIPAVQLPIFRRHCLLPCRLVWRRVESAAQRLVWRRVRWRRLLVCEKVERSHVVRNTRAVVLANTSLLLGNA